MNIIKYFFSKILMMIGFLGAIVAIVAIAIPSVPESLNIYLIPQVWIFLAIGFLTMGVIFGALYRKIKDELVYDEFGVNRKLLRQGRFAQDSADRKIADAQKLAQMESILPQATLRDITHKAPKDPIAELNKLIGIASVKEKVKEIAARSKFEIESKKSAKTAQSESKHMVFYGSPGTGKTTVARIITGILYDYGIAKKNICIEVDGNFLKSRNASDTATKVQMLCKAAMGGVLFVDEAYALTQSKDPSGLQAIATLIKEMEDNRENFTVILAGYPKEMAQMLDSNPGFRSRIRDYITFPDYTEPELIDIALSMAGEKGFAISAEAAEVMKVRFANERRLKTWGNARTVRSVIEESVSKHALNYEEGLLPKDSRYLIDRIDVSTISPNIV